MNQIESYNRIVAIGVDIQNDFIPGGSLAVEGGDEIIKPFNEVTNWVRGQHEGIVTFTRDWHPLETNHFGNPPDYDKTWPVHCLMETLGAAFHKDLMVYSDDPILSKGMVADQDAYSGFQAVAHDGLTLETLVRPVARENVAVVIGGLATDYCVKATVLDSLQFAGQFDQGEVEVYVLSDAIAAVAKESGEEALKTMSLAGARFITSAELLSGQVLEVKERQWTH
jgi:nicotinamidase/pyrazinamidase